MLARRNIELSRCWERKASTAGASCDVSVRAVTKTAYRRYVRAAEVNVTVPGLAPGNASTRSASFAVSWTRSTPGTLPNACDEIAYSTTPVDIDTSTGSTDPAGMVKSPV